MRYLIDGYNVTRRDPATRDLPLEEQRSALERRLKLHARGALGKASYLVVWDAARGAGLERPFDAPVEYTRQPTADDAIVEKVRAASERVGVVTSDRELADRCRAAASCGVEVLPAERLFAAAMGKPSAKRRPGRIVDEGIPANAHAINRELKELWGIDDD
ncbi:NYN domain-containing protein [Arabiibacter massiliensis]|uniref:NYN domain-containing protein n=1 Tax=Arabiibacter massiliensis TaxID=1870985 RepID=UPI00155B2419|nr:NYN domain-containing protein [Arabiibacter massiliensis]